MSKWESGKSGNPSGRPKIDKEVQELARKNSKSAIQKLVDLMQNAEDERVQMAAADKILDRAWGKPFQAITGEGGGPIRLTAELVIGTAPREE